MLTSALGHGQDVLVPVEYQTIQAGIDAVGPAGTVWVVPGTYIESLLIDPDGVHGAPRGHAQMRIEALGPGVVLRAAPLGYRQANYLPSLQTTGGLQIDALLHAQAVSGLEVVGLEFNGDSKLDPAVASVLSCGLSLRDGVASFRDCRFKRVRASATSALPTGYGALVEGPLDATVASFEGCEFLELQHGAVLATTLARCELFDCDLTGRGPTASLAQFGVRFESGAQGLVALSRASGYWWTGAGPEVAAAVWADDAGAAVDVTQSSFKDCQVGYWRRATVPAAATDQVIGNSFTQGLEPASAGPAPVGIRFGGSGSGSSVLIQNNTLNQLEGPGIALESGGATLGGNYFNASGWGSGEPQARDKAGPGASAWAGNSWSDFAVNAGYPFAYLIEGAAGSIDATAGGECPELQGFEQPVGATPSGLALADFTGDGWVDVLTANTGDDTLTLLTNDGAGDFGGAATTVELAPGDRPVAVATGELFVGDGLDAVVAAEGANAVLLLDNDPAGTLSVVETLGLGALGTRPVSVAVGDLNGGGPDDFAVALHGELFSGVGALAVRLDSGAPAALALPGAGLVKPRCVRFGDLDGDGDLDLAASLGGSLFLPSVSENLALYENDGSGGFGAAITLSVSKEPGELALGDLDGDGDLDLAVTVEAAPVGLPGGVAVLRNGGLAAGAWGAWAFAAPAIFATGTAPTALALGDLSGDGLPGFFAREDLFVANFGGSNVSRLNGYLGPALGFQALETCSAGQVPVAVALAHLNADGTLDAAVVNKASNSVTVMLAEPRALAQSFGFGCFGSGGKTPAISADGLPTLGNVEFGVRLAEARPFAPALLGLSLGAAQVPLGGGCDLYLQAPLVRAFAFTDAAGAARVSLPVPGPPFGGVDVFFQYFVFDAFGSVLGEFATSGGLRLKLGL